MTASNFQAALDFIWAPDRDGNSDDSAPGENFLTRWGVTQYTWGSAVALGVVKGSLKDATEAQCAAIYRALYWNAMHSSSLPDGVDFIAFNDAALTGCGHVTRLIQRIVHAKVDGAIGTETLRKIGSFGPKALIDAIAAGDMEYFSELQNAPKFLHGWTRRENDCRAAAYKIARINIASHAPSQSVPTADDLNAQVLAGNPPKQE